jgi:hypothetical protein
MASKPKVPFPFQFPSTAHCRVHGPQGHKSYLAYKPWLRDEFEFRCVYCLTRERWSADGQNRFSVDHVKPKSRHAELTCEYDNLVYACIRCNTLKSTKLGLPDPGKTSLSKHLKLLSPSGIFKWLTPEGRRLIEYLMLNSEDRVVDRRFYLSMYDTQRSWPEDILESRFAYPSDLPDLAKRKPPKGNGRPGGIKTSYYLRQARGELPHYY